MSPHAMTNVFLVQAWRPFCTFLGTLFGVDNWRVWKVPVVKIIMHPEYKKECES